MPVPAAGPALPAPSAKAKCFAARRTVLLKLPRVKGRVLRVVVRVGSRKVRLRRGVAYVRLGRAGSVLRVRITQRYRRGGRVRTKRTTRVLRACK